MFPEIKYTIETEWEDLDPSEYLCTDEPELDALEVAGIQRRLQQGDIWAWCVVQVTATVYYAGHVFTGQSSWLGGCSYEGEQDFTKNSSDYYFDLCDEAREDLLTGLDTAVRIGADARYLKEKIQESEVLLVFPDVSQLDLQTCEVHGDKNLRQQSLPQGENE